MHFHQLKHVYLTYCNEEIVALDLRKDQYIFLSKRLSEIIHLALEEEFTVVNKKYSLVNKDERLLPKNFDEAIKYLRKLQLLSQKDYEFPSTVINLEKENKSTGADNLDWRISLGDLDKKVSKRMVWEAYCALIKVYFTLKIFGFYGLIKSIQKKKRTEFIKKNTKSFNTLATALNKACFYFPVRTKCLEWSAALTLMGLKKKWECNMEIGIQKVPFKAHAWVKANDKVIADTPNLPQTLSVILSEPF